MRKVSGSYAFVATHLLAACAGWAIWSGWAAPSSGNDRSAEGGPLRSKDRGTSAGNGGEVLDRLAGGRSISLDKPLKRAEQFRIRLEQAAVLNALADATPAAEDPATTAAAAVDAWLNAAPGDPNFEKLRQEAEVRMLHWLRKDPAAVLGWFGGIRGEVWKATGPCFRLAMDAVIARGGPESAAPWLGTNSRVDGEINRLIADHAGAQADPAVLARLKGTLDVQQWNSMRLSLIDTWPFAKADGFMRLAASEKAPLSLILYAKSQGTEGISWLQRQLASGNMDPAFRDTILRNGDYHRLMYDSPHLPFGERLEVVKSFNPEKSEEQMKLELGVYDVVKTLNSGRDWRYAFHSGAATAEQIYQEIAGRLPELAAEAPESLKLQLFKELSEFGGPGAINLLDDLPPEKKWEMAAKAPQWQFNEGNPQDFHDFLQAIPADAGGKAWDMRLQAWESKTGGNRNRFGRQYAGWVLGLPDGIDAEIAAYALLKRGQDPDTAEDLRAKVKDPRLTALLEKKP